MIFMFRMECYFMLFKGRTFFGSKTTKLTDVMSLPCVKHLVSGQFSNTIKILVTISTDERCFMVFPNVTDQSASPVTLIILTLATLKYLFTMFGPQMTSKFQIGVKC